MNLEKPEIRSILSEIYHEGCLLDNCDMRELAVVLEHIAESLYAYPTIVAWQKIKLDRQRFDKAPYTGLLVKFKESVLFTLKRKIIKSVHELIEKKQEMQAFNLWFNAYVDALLNWEGDIFGPLCKTLFNFSSSHKKQIENYVVLNYLILDSKWPETFEYFLELGKMEALTSFQRSSFMVYAGQVMMYHLNYPDKAKSLFDTAKSLEPGNVKVERVFGEYALVMKDLEQARSHFLNAVSIDAHEIENYNYMGDTYLEEKKWNAAEQWYNDALNINFMDTLPLSRLIILSGEEELIDSRKDFIDDLLNKAKLLERNRDDENYLYNLYRDAGYAYSKTAKYEQSVNYYKKAVELKPDYSTAMIDMAYILAYNKQYDEAEKWFKKSINAGMEGINFASYWGLGWLYEQTNDIDKSLEYYKKCIGLRSYGNDRVFNILGILNYNKGLYDEAVSNYKKAIAENSTETVYFDNLKNAIEKKGDQKELQTFYEQLAATFPNNYEYLNQIGVYYHNQADYKKAIEFYSRAISLEPKRSVYWENRALAKELLVLYDEAEQDYLKALALGENANLLNSLGVIKFRQKDFKRALAYFNHSIELESNNPLYYENLGLAQENLNDFAGAEENYRKAIEISKEDARYLNRLGLFYHNRASYDEALKWYKKASEKDEGNILYLENVAIAYENLKDYEKAEAIYNRLLTDHEDDLFINTRLISVKLFQKKYDDVLKKVEKLLQKFPEASELYQIKGMVYEEQFLYEKAIETYEKALELDPQSEYFNNRMGIMHYYIGTQEDLNLALSYYQKAIDANPDMGIYYKNIELVYRALGDEKAAQAANQKAIDLEKR